MINQNIGMNNQELIIAAFSVTLVFFILGLFAILFLLIHRKKQKRNLIEKEQLQAQFSHVLLRTQLEIQEQTFKTISQEIHDNIGQVLSLAKLNLNTLDFTKEEATKEKTTSAKELVGKAIQDLRDLSKTLNTENIALLGLTKAIEQELQMLEKTGVIQTNLKIQGAVVPLEPQKELILFRIIQEALNNIMKHANASLISIVADYKENLNITINDNGEGFDTNETSLAQGSGLRNMKSRSTLIGAGLTIDSKKDKGTEILLSLPLT
jgi:signal transduction histidine kinase